MVAVQRTGHNVIEYLLLLVIQRLHSIEESLLLALIFDAQKFFLQEVRPLNPPRHPSFSKKALLGSLFPQRPETWLQAAWLLMVAQQLE